MQTATETDRYDHLVWFVRALGPWHNRSGPLYRRVADALNEAILSGRLRPGEQLPSHREIASEFGLSRSTAIRAYEEVRAAGLLESRARSGNFVSLGVGRRNRENGSWIPGRGDLSNPIDLSKASTRADEAVVAVFRDSIPDLSGVITRDGYDVLGIPELRKAVAATFDRRGLPTSQDQIIITLGAQQGIDLVARLLVRANDSVIVESPTYAGLIDRIRFSQAEMISLDVSETPWNAERFEHSIRRTGARLAFLTPDYHNPTGRLMDRQTRESIASLSERAGVTLVVDETNVELGLDQPAAAMPPLAASMSERSSITIGSLSKCIWAGLRIGWIRADANTIQALANLKITSSLSNPLLEQLAAVRMLDPEWFEPQMQKRKRELHAKRKLMQDTIQRIGLVTNEPQGGLSCWVKLPPGSTSRGMAQHALQYGLLLLPGTRLSPDGLLDTFLRLPFSLPMDELQQACWALEAAWAGLKEHGLPHELFNKPIV